MPKYQDKTQRMIDRGPSPFKDEFFSSAWKELARESHLQNARFLPPVKAVEKSNYRASTGSFSEVFTLRSQSSDLRWRTLLGVAEMKGFIPGNCCKN